jgi:hypothetical protein
LIVKVSAAYTFPLEAALPPRGATVTSKRLATKDDTHSEYFPSCPEKVSTTKSSSLSTGLAVNWMLPNAVAVEAASTTVPLTDCPELSVIAEPLPASLNSAGPGVKPDTDTGV